MLAVVLLVLVSSCKKQEAASSKLTPKIDSLFATAKDFSGVVLVADSGKVLYHKAFGYRNFDAKEAMDTTSIFELASVSKQFTAMVIMMLKEEGKLRYDDPIDKYIPGLPYKDITIRHLLTHTSGLPDYQQVMDEHWDKTKVAGNPECIEYLIQYHPPIHFIPGEKYEYSNTGYMLLASIAEKASGIDFISFARTRIFVPLEMTSTDIRSQEQKTMLRNMAWGHIWVNEKNVYVRADSMIQFNYGIWLGNRKGPGRISSTTSDLLKWDQALYKNQLVSDSTLQEAFTPIKENYGFGWMIVNDPKFGKLVWHNGDNPGYKTKIMRFIDRHRTVIVLCNNAHDKFNDLVNGVASIANL